MSTTTKAYVIEMTRSVERRLRGGEFEVLATGTRYTVDEATAAVLCAPTREMREINGAMQEVEIEPAATQVRVFEIGGDADRSPPAPASDDAADVADNTEE